MNALAPILRTAEPELETWLRAEVRRRSGESGVKLRLALSALDAGRVGAAIELFDRLALTGLAGEAGFLGLSLAYREKGEMVSAAWAASQAATLNQVLSDGDRARLYQALI